MPWYPRHGKTYPNDHCDNITPYYTLYKQKHVLLGFRVYSNNYRVVIIMTNVGQLKKGYRGVRSLYIMSYVVKGT